MYCAIRIAFFFALAYCIIYAAIDSKYLSGLTPYTYPAMRYACSGRNKILWLTVRAMYGRAPVSCACWFIRRAFRRTGSAWDGMNTQGNQGKAASEQGVRGLGTGVRL